jgi:hypothetical protein
VPLDDQTAVQALKGSRAWCRPLRRSWPMNCSQPTQVTQSVPSRPTLCFHPPSRVLAPRPGLGWRPAVSRAALTAIRVRCSAVRKCLPPSLRFHVAQVEAMARGDLDALPAIVMSRFGCWQGLWWSISARTELFGWARPHHLPASLGASVRLCRDLTRS